MADVPTWGALVFGGVGSFAAARSLLIQASEHKRLTAELAKRADFEITIQPDGFAAQDVGPDSASYVTEASEVGLRFAIGIRNTGSRAATHVTLNFLSTDRHDSLVWVDPQGNPAPERTKAALTTEKLSDAQTGAATRWLAWDFERIAVRTPRTAWAKVDADVPIGGSADFRVRARVQSDDLPDEVPERVKDYVVHLHHASALM